MVQLNKFIASLNLNLKAGNLFFRCSRTKFTLDLIKVLVKQSYLLGYYQCYEDPTKLIVFFKVSLDQAKPLILSCQKFTKQPKYVCVKSIRNLQAGSSLWLLSTTRGIMTAQEAWAYGIGGVVLCRVC